ncbi:hypothetical protein QVD17_09810 [Tagetes erecta]|uniref:Uncharacterized protein n=1 Tax=Tagetes erecta TaxID=13708 RepID=A0AAD8L191_TARER|nr:hypothetical protein QVD17_09810 [Tagetes erecta]
MVTKSRKRLDVVLEEKMATSVQTNDNEDSWLWPTESSGCFSTKSCREKIESKQPNCPEVEVLWLPIKGQKFYMEGISRENPCGKHGIEKKDHSLGHVLYNLDDMEDPKRRDFHEESKDSRQTPRRCEATIIQLDQLQELKTNGKLGELVQIAL